MMASAASGELFRPDFGENLVPRPELAEITFVNSDFQLPIEGWPEHGYRKDSSTPPLPPPQQIALLRRFFVEISHESQVENTRPAYVLSGMNRAAMFPGLFEFRNSRGGVFFSVNIKPVGITQAFWEQVLRTFTDLESQELLRTVQDTHPKYFIAEQPDLDEIRGSAKYDSLQADVDNSLRLNRGGARVTLPLVLIRAAVPEEIRAKFPDLQDNQQFGSEARAQRNPHSILDLYIATFGSPEATLSYGAGKDPDKADRMIALAKVLLNREGIKPQPIESDADYLKTFMEVFGKDVVGSFIKQRYIFRSLGARGGFDSGHNVTLGIEAKDHDTGHFIKGKISERDWQNLINSYFMGITNCAMLYYAVREHRDGSLLDHPRDHVEDLFTLYNYNVLSQLSIGDRLEFHKRITELINHSSTKNSSLVLNMGGEQQAHNLNDFFIKMLNRGGSSEWRGAFTRFWGGSNKFDAAFLDKLPRVLSSLEALRQFRM